ncbi:MAG: hypothetical protein U1B78_03300, partial [Dehalococcoidia bacterium]|nr:hypothetical protein [Dehalococcoidia bacterium]
MLRPAVRLAYDADLDLDVVTRSDLVADLAAGVIPQATTTSVYPPGTQLPEWACVALQGVPADACR